MPYPCSHFCFDINFGNRLYSKEKRPDNFYQRSLIVNICSYLRISKFDTHFDRESYVPKYLSIKPKPYYVKYESNQALHITNQ